MKKILLCVIVLILITGCAENRMLAEVGFWHGLWHGWILVISWICSLFVDNVAVYAVYNNGCWYDTGFVFGVVCFAGAGSVR